MLSNTTKHKKNEDYRHFGRIGDIWKHLPLCAVVVNEDIQTYVETNSAYFDYELEHSLEQNYGIGLFIEKAKRYQELSDSEYYKLIKPFFDKNKYLGSCGQVIHLLKDQPDKYIFFDLDKEALSSIEKSVVGFGLSHKVETVQKDSATGLINLIPILNSKSFVHIDPYVIYQKNKDGHSYLDGFFEAVKKGIKCFLWYGFDTLNEKRKINDYILSGIKQTDPNTISCDELILNEIQDNTVSINPGVLGCGILTGNLSEKSIGIISRYANLLVDVYNDSPFNGASGGLYYDKKI
jgi:23S rRNA (adenine2030-N6)-methyltransferase